MSQSKLEMHVGILSVLSHLGPLKLTHITYKANVNGSVLSEYLEFLLKQGLVDERHLKKNRIVYTLTQSEITVLKAFIELKQALPLCTKTKGKRLYFSS